jgi:hypothetical protein
MITNQSTFVYYIDRCDIIFLVIETDESRAFTEFGPMINIKEKNIPQTNRDTFLFHMPVFVI